MSHPEHEAFKIINRETGGQEGAYSRAYHTVYEFTSPEEARNSNCHQIFQDKVKYKIQKWKVTYELVDDDCDPPCEEETAEALKRKQEDELIEAEMDELGINGVWERMDYHLKKRYEMRCRSIYLEISAKYDQNNLA